MPSRDDEEWLQPNNVRYVIGRSKILENLLGGRLGLNSRRCTATLWSNEEVPVPWSSLPFKHEICRRDLTRLGRVFRNRVFTSNLEIKSTTRLETLKDIR